MKKLLALCLLLLPATPFAQDCRITSPLPIPISIQGCTYNSNLPGGSTSYIQNMSSLQSGATAYPDFLYVGSSVTTPALVDTGLTAGNCVQAGTNGLLTSAAGACGSGGGSAAGSNGQLQYNDSGSFGANAGLSFSSTTSSGLSVSSITIGDVLLHPTFNSTDGVSAYGLTFQSLIDNARVFRFADSSNSATMTFDMENRRIGFFTNTPSKSVDMNSDVKITGTAYIGSGASFTTTSGIYSFQGTATMASGSAVVTNAIVDSTWLIYLTIQSPSGTVGSVYVSSFTANTTFNIKSTNGADNSTVAWLMVGTH